MPGAPNRSSVLSLSCLAIFLASSGLLMASGAQSATPDATGAAPPAPADNMPVRPSPPPPPVAYLCEDGTRIIARFPDSSIAMLVVGEDRYELTAGPAASGVRYRGGQVEFWTHQGAARFTRQAKTTECHGVSTEPPETPGNKAPLEKSPDGAPSGAPTPVAPAPPGQGNSMGQDNSKGKGKGNGSE